MKQYGGWQFPDGEMHFPQWMGQRNEIVNGRLTYQHHKLVAALAWVKDFGVAVDVGGHVGTWSRYLATKFGHVHAFEPVAEFRACFEANVDAPNVTLYPFALGAYHGTVTMAIDPADSGGTHVASMDGDVEIATLDSCGISDVDFLKIDCEGFELEVLKGAVETLKRCKPCVIVEQKQHKLLPNFGIKGTPAVDFLKDLGAIQRREISGDYILSF